VTPLQEQRTRRALSIARGAKLAAFEAVEDAIGAKEAVAAFANYLFIDVAKLSTRENAIVLKSPKSLCGRWPFSDTELRWPRRKESFVVHGRRTTIAR
jgi:hypothetical protein